MKANVICPHCGKPAFAWDCPELTPPSPPTEPPLLDLTLYDREVTEHLPIRLRLGLLRALGGFSAGGPLSLKRVAVRDAIRVSYDTLWVQKNIGRTSLTQMRWWIAKAGLAPWADPSWNPALGEAE